MQSVVLGGCDTEACRIVAVPQILFGAPIKIDTQPIPNFLANSYIKISLDSSPSMQDDIGL